MTQPDESPHGNGALSSISCSDGPVAMRVVRVYEHPDLALCEAHGRPTIVDTVLLGSVQAGESLLVHSGTAIQRVS